MATTPAPLEIPLGDDVVIPLAFQNPDGSAFNLTGGSARFRMIPVSQFVDKAANTVTKTTPNGIVVTDAVNGLSNLILVRADTTALEPGTYKYSAQGINAAGLTSTEIIGLMIWTDHPLKN